MVLNPERKMPPNVKQINATTRLSLIENVNIPIKKPKHPIINKIDNFFCGDSFAIIKDPIKAPRPSDDANIPISNSLKFN